MLKARHAMSSCSANVISCSYCDILITLLTDLQLSTNKNHSLLFLLRGITYPLSNLYLKQIAVNSCKSYEIYSSVRGSDKTSLNSGWRIFLIIFVLCLSNYRDTTTCRHICRLLKIDLLHASSRNDNYAKY